MARLSEKVISETLAAIKATKGNRTKAAQLLGMSRRGFGHRLHLINKQRPGPDQTFREEDDNLELPDLPAEDDISAEEILDHLENTFEKRKKYNDARHWMTIKLKRNEPIAINWFGDPHLGSNSCDYARIREHTRIVSETKNMYGANIGDVADNWPWGGRLLQLYADMTANKARERALAKWFLEEAGIKWLIWLEGNHDRMDPGFVTYLRTVNANRIPMIDWRARFKVEFPNGQTFKIDSSHDHKGHSMWHNLHGQIRASLSGAAICDLYIAGHRHCWAYAMNEMPDGEIVHLARCRGYKFYDDHAVHHGYHDQQQGCSIVTILDPTTTIPTERLRVFADTAAGADYLNYLLQKG